MAAEDVSSVGGGCPAEFFDAEGAALFSVYLCGQEGIGGVGDLMEVGDEKTEMSR